MFPELVALRRHLHSAPELSGSELKTVQHLKNWLAQKGISANPVTDDLGLLVDFDDDPALKRFAMRADMDALQIQDAKQVDYRSQVEGVMHACGHDVHSTILAGCLATIKRLTETGKLPWPVRLRGIFQPAEEICVGASRMIAAHALDQVSAIFAFHVDPFRKVGSVGYRSGVMSASCDELIVTVTGKGGHAARPHHTRDPITAAAQFLTAVHVQVPRGTDSLDTVVVGFGSIKGGEQCNVIPDCVRMRGTLRTLTPETRTEALGRIKEIADAIGKASRTEIKVEIGANTPSVINDPAVTSLAESIVVDVLGQDRAEVMEQPSMGGEDFAYYLERVPGTLLRIGSKPPGAEPTGLHTPMFDVDEEVIRHGVTIMTRVAIEWCRPDGSS